MASAKELAAHFSELAGRKDQYDIREIEGVDGTKQTQLIDKDSGSISFAWNGDLPEVEDVAGTVGGDKAVNPKESVSDESKVWRTSRGALATPTQPEALEPVRDAVEIDHTGSVTEDAHTVDGPKAK